MTNRETGALVFQNAAGHYFLVPRETLEQGQVPEQHMAEVKQLIAAASRAGASADDVQGHILPALVGFSIGGYSVLAGYYLPELGQAIDWQGALQQRGG
jgi:hypothetical protein